MPPLPIYILFERVRGYAVAPMTILREVRRLLWFIIWSAAFVALLFALGYAMEHGLPYVMEKLNHAIHAYISRGTLAWP